MIVCLITGRSIALDFCSCSGFVIARKVLLGILCNSAIEQNTVGIMSNNKTPVVHLLQIQEKLNAKME